MEGYSGIKQGAIIILIICFITGQWYPKQQKQDILELQDHMNTSVHLNHKTILLFQRLIMFKSVIMKGYTAVIPEILRPAALYEI